MKEVQGESLADLSRRLAPAVDRLAELREVWLQFGEALASAQRGEPRAAPRPQGRGKGARGASLTGRAGGEARPSVPEQEVLALDEEVPEWRKLFPHLAAAAGFDQGGGGQRSR